MKEGNAMKVLRVHSHHRIGRQNLFSLFYYGR